MPKVHRVLLKAKRAFIMEKKPTPWRTSMGLVSLHSFEVVRMYFT